LIKHKFNKNPRIAIAGSVNSSITTLSKLIDHNMNIVLVLGLNPTSAINVSGFRDMRELSEKHGLPFSYFSKINDSETVQLIEKAKPDILFVIGLSQIIKKSILDIPSFGSIGYHPTKLPEGRGRAAIAWIILGEAKPAVTFFLIDEGMDSGDIIYQKELNLSEDPYAQDVIDSLVFTIESGLDEILPQIKGGYIFARSQNNDDATYLEIRKPNDGLINWENSAIDIYRLIRAVSKPLPGAFTYFNRNKLIIWNAQIDTKIKVKGVPGRILRIDSDKFWIQSGNGVLKVNEYSIDNDFKPKIGIKLGLCIEDFLN